MEKINGWKTYIIGMGLICYAIGGFVAGKIEVTSAIESMLIGLGLIGLRHGIKWEAMKEKVAS